ncbi:helix-turn-helix transcriptional regulator [Flammeovirga kamogawensis]|uniref:Helix-turn-helix transcriptional regulator n=1 Tax=Flammeovirga kamogawensis TaxID=373891 RepID=A0ABX8GRU4_9BACT|nr:helix-turn-helix transcriptional regulator [Flammeovirga kamogawensis]MBB6463053.1 AraC-like DNA-binding protein [Flammeovirga kamogawensis]QWG05690.1 helix-turn-helix transcriptional regulator [Flammeovirga kamogawensis]TRX67518.1 helix-turn-helix transcriptional regulator [Flammeovirga kamogawensis]
MEKLLHYWNQTLQGEVDETVLKFDNELGNGFIEAYELTSRTKFIRIDIFLHQKLTGEPFIFEDEDKYLPIIFGDASSIFLGGRINEALNGVLLSNNKENLAWELSVNRRIQLVMLRVEYNYFYKLIERAPSLKSLCNPEQVYTVFEEMTPLMKGSFYRMFEIQHSLYKQELLFACSFYIFHLLIESLSQREKIKEEEGNSLNIKLLMKARYMISETEGIPLEIDFLAKECGISVSSLRSQFKKAFGLPVYQFQQQVRLEQAKKALMKGDKSIFMISADLGFSSMSHFSSLFKKEFDITPKKFQLQFRT